MKTKWNGPVEKVVWHWQRDKEWAIACANRDSFQFESWQMDYYKPIAEAQQEIDWLLHKLNANDGP